MIKNYHYKIINKGQNTSGFVQLSMRPADGSAVFNFKPGQYLTISAVINGEVLADRPFSISSSPTNRAYLQITFKVQGNYTHLLAEIRIGDIVTISGPYGKFTFSEKRDYQTVLIAGGIGITPILSMMRYATDRQLPHHITLLYSNKTLDSTPFIPEINDLLQKNRNLYAHFHLTQEKPSSDSRFKTTRIDKAALQQYLIDYDHNTTFFICGPPVFTNSIKEGLLELGFAKNNIITEEFSLAPSKFLPDERGFVTTMLTTTAFVLLFSLYFVYQTAQAKINTTTQTTATAQTTPSPSPASPTSSQSSVPETSQNNNSNVYYVPPTISNQTPMMRSTPMPRTRLS